MKNKNFDKTSKFWYRNRTFYVKSTFRSKIENLVKQKN